VARIRQVFGEQVKRIFDSGKVVASGCVSDARGGFFLLRVDSPENLFKLLGGALLDHCHVGIHPVISYQKLAENFLGQSV
jgi:hypothetical protein